MGWRAGGVSPRPNPHAVAGDLTPVKADGTSERMPIKNPNNAPTRATSSPPRPSASPPIAPTITSRKPAVIGWPLGGSRRGD
jgi:hypothetical protein